MGTLSTKLLAITVAAYALTGCANAAAPEPENSQPTPAQHAQALHDPSVIPNASGPKVHSTNEHGNTTYGMGTSVYSMIGSSGLHANGFSAHLESRLSGAGIPDVRVFVFDDTVVLAAEKQEASASRYDEVQRKVLSQSEGLSAKGVSPDYGIGGIKGTESGSHDNLTMAASQIKTLMGADVKVLTVTGRKAVEAIEKIRADALAKDMSPSRIANDIRVLLELVEAGGG